MEKIMGEIMQEHVDRLMMLGTLSADDLQNCCDIAMRRQPSICFKRQKRFENSNLIRKSICGVDFLFLITAKMIATTVG